MEKLHWKVLFGRPKGGLFDNVKMALGNWSVFNSCPPPPLFPPPRCPFGCEAVDVIEHLDEVQSRDSLSLTAIEPGFLAVPCS